MAKSCFAKACIFFGVVLLCTAGGILAWVFLKDDNNNNNDGNNSSSKNNNNGGGSDSSSDGSNPTSTIDDKAIRLTIAPTAMPSTTPVYRYPFDQCSSSSSRSSDNNMDDDDDFMMTTKQLQFTLPNSTTSNSTTSISSSSPSNSITCCNGLDNLCDWPVQDILFAGVHNAQATSDTFLVPNHNLPVKKALEAGYRGINLDVCNCQGTYQLCHGVCGLGQADPNEIVTDIVTFLNDNPNEVILLTMELNSQAGQAVNLDDFNTTILANIDGFHEYLYQHPTRDDEWPTLRTLIETDERLLVFHLNGPTCGDDSPCPVGLHYYFDYFQETQFDIRSIDDMLDVGNSCLVTRGATTTTGAFFAVNNFITSATAFLSNPEATAAITNDIDFAQLRLKNCAALIQAGPYRGDGDVNIMYVDYWSVGDMVEVVQEYNRDLGLYTGGGGGARQRQRLLR